MSNWRTRFPRKLEGVDGQGMLRLLVLAPVMMLFVAIAVRVVASGHLADSLSAYYCGPTRDVLVGVLCAVALGLIAYRGTNHLEDATLNIAGFYAPLIALIPFDLEEDICRIETNVSALRLGMVAYFSAIGAFVIVDYLRGRWAIGELWKLPKIRIFVVLEGISLVAFGVLVVRELLREDPSTPKLHVIAAVLFFLHLALAVASHLWEKVRCGDLVSPLALEPPPEPTGKTRRRYQLILILMVLGGVGAVAWLLLAPNAFVLLYLEIWEILLFGVFWVGELVRLDGWGPAERKEMLEKARIC